MTSPVYKLKPSFSRRLMVVLSLLATGFFAPHIHAQTQDAQFISGSFTILPDATGTSVTMQLAGVQDEQTNSGAHSGSLGFELWYLPSPFSGGGGPVSGNKVAAAYLPISNCTKSYLDAAEICSSITVQSNLVPPSAGTYYPVLFLVEHSSTCTGNSGFCYIDHIALINLQTGGSTVTVQSSSGGAGGGSTGRVVFSGSSAINSLNWQTQRADLSIPAIQNHSNTLSGTIAVALWLQSTPYNGSSLDTGYKAVFYTLPASCTTGNAQLQANSGCTPFDTGSIPLTPVPAGTYYPVLLLEEYCGATSGSGYCVDAIQTFQNPVTVSYPSGGGGIGSPSGGSGGVGLVGTQNASFDYSGGTVDLAIGGVNNATVNTTGTLEVEVWFTTSPYTGGGFTGTKVASYRLPASCTVGYNQLPPNSGCSSFDTGRITASYPNPGTYYAILAVDEYSSTNSACASNGGFCLASAVQLDQTVTVPQQTVVTPLVDTGGSTGGGGGAIDLFILGGLLILVCARDTRCLRTRGPTV
jgi:hypothetical protein